MLHARKIVELPSMPAAVFSIGTFDGLHLGHQAILKEIATQKQRLEQEHGGAIPSVMITFHQHPLEVIAPQRRPEYIFPPARKAQILEELTGVDYLVLMEFTPELAATDHQSFIERILSRAERAVLVEGHNFRFGHKNRGDVVWLSEYASQQSRMEFFQVDPVTLDSGEIISSTKVRQAITDGDMRRVRKMLARPYQIWGSVFPGDRYGTEIGFPTANLIITEQALPKYGVYATRGYINEKPYEGMTYVGRKSKELSRSGEPLVLVETNFFNYNGGDLYGHDIKLEFYEYMRGDEHIPDLEVLKSKLAHDKECCLDYFKKH